MLAAGKENMQVEIHGTIIPKISMCELIINIKTRKHDNINNFTTKVEKIPFKICKSFLCKLRQKLH